MFRIKQLWPGSEVPDPHEDTHPEYSSRNLKQAMYDF
jgi:hypothetical protein